MRAAASTVLLVLLPLWYKQPWATSASAAEATYLATEDRTWAVLSDTLTDPMYQAVYDSFMGECRDAAGTQAAVQCDSAERHRLHMNTNQPRSVYNYSETGFLKIRAPAPVVALIHEFWEQNKGEAIVEWDSITPYHTTWNAPPTILRVDNATLPGGGPQLQAAIANAARDAIEAWTGVPQMSSSVYGIRIYHNNSILTPHCDRIPLISSAIINVAQDVDEPWFLEVYGHDGVAHNVSMEPGDMVLYESHSVIHGRPFPMRGNYYAGVFVHFEPMGPPPQIPASNDTALPPYLIPDSSWAEEWKNEHPGGWKLQHDAIKMVERNDVKAIRYIGSVNASQLLLEDDGTPAEWKPIHEAARQGYVEILKYLIEELGADPNEPCRVKASPTPLAIALKFRGANDPCVAYLESVNGVVSVPPMSNEEL